MTGLHVANQGTTSSLFTNWTQAVGDVEFYQVLLIHENVVIKNENVSSETSTYNFHSLKSGSLYSVVVTTVSGGISSRQAVVEGRTGKNSTSRNSGTSRVPFFKRSINRLISGLRYHPEGTCCPPRNGNWEVDECRRQ